METILQPIHKFFSPITNFIKYRNNPLKKPPKEKNLINKKLSIDLINVIFSFLNEKEYIHCRLINKYWNNIITEKEINQKQLFILALTSIFKKRPLEEQRDFVDYLNLKLISNKISLGKLIELNNHNAMALKNLNANFPPFQKNLLTQSLGLPKHSHLELLLCQGSIQEIIDLASAMPNGENKIAALQNICDFLISNDRIKEAIDLANTIPFKDDPSKTKTFRGIGERLVMLTQKTKIEIKLAVELAKTMPAMTIKIEVLQKLCCLLISKGCIKEAIDLANTAFPDKEGSKDRIFFDDIITPLVELIKMDKIDIKEAIQLANNISSPYYKSKVLQEICDRLTEKNLIKEAIDLTKDVSCEYHQNAALKKISDELIKQGRTREAQILRKTKFLIRS